jgi:peptidoglycan/xylan/chitin deacetylase (PgdA/CDA1 family)
LTTSQRNAIAPGLGTPRRIRILRYHRIIGDNDSSVNSLCINAKNFRRQVETIERWGYSFITFDDYRLFLKGQINLPGRPVVLAFDQSYRDNHTYMFPILQKLGIRGVVFAIGSSVLGEVSTSIKAATPDSDLMGDKELLELHGAGFEIGSCGMVYTKLTLLTHDEAFRSIADSRMKLEILLNAPVLSFSYPYGVFTDDIKRTVMSAGYTIACSTHSRSRGLSGDLFDVRCIPVTQTSGDLNIRSRLFLG